MEGWESNSIRFINGLVESTPKRLEDVIKGNGAMTGH